jgi:hypothetical protein
VRAAKELVRNAGTDVSLLKNQTKSLEKMLDLGGLSTFVEQGIVAKINGKEILPTPNFSVESKGKTRLVANFSHVPIRFARDPNAENWSINTGYDIEQTTMGFCSLRDRAAHALACYGFVTVLVDMSGWFHQIMNTPQLLHLNMKVVAIPLTDDPNGKVEVVVVPLHTCEMGSAVSAMVCGTLNSAFVDAADKRTISENLFSLPRSEISSPERFGLSKCHRNESQFRKDEKKMAKLRSKKLGVQKSKMNEFEYAHQTDKMFAAWRCGSERMKLTLTHQDDTLLAHKSVDRLMEAAEKLYEFYQKANWVTSTTLKKEDLLAWIKFLGFQQNFDGEGGDEPTFGLPEDKWRLYSVDVTYLATCKLPPTIGRLLQIAGRLAHVCEIFPWARPSLAPLAWILAGANAICKSDKAAWRKLAKRTFMPPKIVVDMIVEIWKEILGKSTKATIFVIIEEDCDMMISTDWAPSGLGMVCVWNKRDPSRNGEHIGVPIPEHHPLRTNHEHQSTFGELFAEFLAIEFWTRNTVGMRISVRGDNTGALITLQRFRCIPVNGVLVMMIARLLKEREIVLVPRYVDTNSIVADPLTHVGDRSVKNKTWQADFRRRMNFMHFEIGNFLPQHCMQVDFFYRQYARIAARYPLNDVTKLLNL